MRQDSEEDRIFAECNFCWGGARVCIFSQLVPLHCQILLLCSCPPSIPHCYDIAELTYVKVQISPDTPPPPLQFWGLGQEWLKWSRKHCYDLPGHVPAGPVEKQPLLLKENVFGWISSTLAEHFSAPSPPQDWGRLRRDQSLEWQSQSEISMQIKTSNHGNEIWVYCPACMLFVWFTPCLPTHSVFLICIPAL